MEDIPNLIEKTKDCGSQKIENDIILQPLGDFKQIPGNEFHFELAEAINNWLRIPEEKLKQIREIGQITHKTQNAIEAIENKSNRFRVVPTPILIHRIESIINAANYGLFLAVEKVHQLEHPDAIKVYTEQILEKYRGQGMEIHWRTTRFRPTDVDYKIMTIRKSSLFVMLIRLMELFSANNEDFSKLAAILGLYFQVIDGCCKTCLKEFAENMFFGANNVPCTYTYSVMTEKSCKHTTHFKHTADVLDELYKQAQVEIARLGGNHDLDVLLPQWNTPSFYNKPNNTTSMMIIPNTNWNFIGFDLEEDVKLKGIPCTNENLSNTIRITKDPSMKSKYDKILLQPFNDMPKDQEIHIRYELIRAFNQWFRIPNEKLDEILNITLYDASIFNAAKNYNSTSGSILYAPNDIPRRICGANYLIFQKLEKVQQLGHPDAAKVFTQQLLELYRGQDMEMYWRKTGNCPSEFDYKLIALRKSCGLVLMAISLMQLLSDKTEDYSKLMAILGVYIQIRIDYCKMFLIEDSIGMVFPGDCTGNNLLFPLVHAFHKYNEILRIFEESKLNLRSKMKLLEVLETLGSFKYTREVLEKLDTEARAEIALLGGNEALIAVLDSLLKWKIPEFYQ